MINLRILQDIFIRRTLREQDNTTSVKGGMIWKYSIITGSC